MNCGLAAWSVRLFAAFLLVQCIFVLVFGSAGWTAYMVPPEPDGDHSGAAAAAMHGSGSSADGHSMIDEASTRRILAEGSAPDAELQMAMVAARQEVNIYVSPSSRLRVGVTATLRESSSRAVGATM